MSFQTPRMQKNACSRWDGNASVSAVPKCLDASIQPLLPLVPRGRMGKLQVTVLSFAGHPQDLTDQRLEFSWAGFTPGQ